MPPTLEEEEHRGRVGRAHHRAEEQRLQPWKAQREMRGGSEDRGRDDHAKRREHDRRQGRLLECGELCPEAGIEQDDGKRYAAEEVGGAGIVEDDAEAVLTGEQPDGEEDEQDRSAEAEGEPAGEDRRHDEPGADQNRQVHRLEHRAVPVWSSSVLIRAKARRGPVAGQASGEERPQGWR